MNQFAYLIAVLAASCFSVTSSMDKPVHAMDDSYSVRQSPEAFTPGIIIVEAFNGTELLWKRRLALDSLEVRASGSGAVVGIGIRHQDAPRKVLMFVVGPDGETRMLRTLDLHHSKMVHGPNLPTVKGVLIHENLDRCSFRLIGLDPKRPAFEEWLCYSLSDGSSLGTIDPVSGQQPLEDCRLMSLMHAEVIPDSPLTLVQWWRGDNSLPFPENLGTRFSLIDAKGNAIWSLDLPTDFVLSGTWRQRSRHWDSLRAQGTSHVLDSSSFATFSAAKGHVTQWQLNSTESAWEVTQTAIVPTSLQEWFDRRGATSE